jgi:hypothetical protein
VCALTFGYCAMTDSPISATEENGFANYRMDIR